MRESGRVFPKREGPSSISDRTKRLFPLIFPNNNKDDRHEEDGQWLVDECSVPGLMAVARAACGS